MAAPTLAMEVGDPAPTVILPDLLTGVPVLADSLLDDHPWTLLLIWNTECSECVGDVVRVGRWWHDEPPPTLGLITIATDDDAVADARRVVRGGRLRCPHLSDRRGTVAALFDAREPSFNAFLLDSTGVVRWRRHDHPPDLQAMFEEIEGLVQGGEEAPRGR